MNMTTVPSDKLKEMQEKLESQAREIEKLKGQLLSVAMEKTEKRLIFELRAEIEELKRTLEAYRVSALRDADREMNLRAALVECQAALEYATDVIDPQTVGDDDCKCPVCKALAKCKEVL
jgi:hypothetical protein